MRQQQGVELDSAHLHFSGDGKLIRDFVVGFADYMYIYIYLFNLYFFVLSRFLLQPLSHFGPTKKVHITGWSEITTSDLEDPNCAAASRKHRVIEPCDLDGNLLLTTICSD